MRVNEIFYSIQGEGYHAGTAAVFIRFSGCNLKCPFCDTDFTQYTEMTEDEITDEVAKYDAELCVITGGEPTLYPQITEVIRYIKSRKNKLIATIATNEIIVPFKPSGFFSISIPAPSTAAKMAPIINA